MKRFCKHYHGVPAPPNVKRSSGKETQIIKLCRDGCLSDALRLLNSVCSGEISSKHFLYASLLQSCVKLHSFNHGLQIHSQVIKLGIEVHRFIGNALLSLYFKLCEDFSDARRVFDGLSVKDVVSWTSMISGYVRAGRPRRSLELFRQMLDSGADPNGFTLSAVIKACSELGASRPGRCLHGVASRRGFDTCNFVSCALIEMYEGSRELEDARKVFDELVEPDAACWTSVIAAFTRNNLCEEALGSFFLMQGRICGLSPDEFPFGSALIACGKLGRLKQGREMHSKVITTGICGEVIVDSSLVDMYGKCGSIHDARHVFDRMPRKNAVSWSALLGCYCQNGNFDTVVELFRSTEKGDLYSIATVLSACAGLAMVRPGKEIHCRYVRCFSLRDICVESSLVDLYAKCGCIDLAYRVFTQMGFKNLITWNVMIGGFAKNGRGMEALRIFHEMTKQGTRPNNITFVGVLFACSHSGLVQEGREYFNWMTKEYQIKAEIEHYNCMVDLLSRAGQMEEAERLIKLSEFENDSALWLVLLGGCTTCTSSDVAERVAKKMMELEPEHPLSYVLLSKLYRAVGRWNDAFRIKRLMNERGVMKIPGISWS